MIQTIIALAMPQETAPADSTVGGVVDAARDEIATVAELFEQLSVGKVGLALIVLILAYTAVRVVGGILTRLGNRAPRARFAFNILGPVLGFVVWVAAGVLILFGILSPSQATVLAVLASVGIAFGLGAQELVKSLIGGMVILVDRPYQLGDLVRIGDAYGEIDHIGLRSTKLTTPDDTRVTIPNGELLTGMAWNANSGNPDCQVVTDLFVPHDTDPIEVTQVATEAAYSSPYVLLSKPVVVRLQDRFQDGPYVQVRVKAYVYDHRFERAFQTDITTRAKAEFLARGMLRRWSRHDLEQPTAELRQGDGVAAGPR